MFEVLHDGIGDRHILEHPLELGGELAAAFGLEFGNHVFLAVVADRFVE